MPLEDPGRADPSDPREPWDAREDARKTTLSLVEDAGLPSRAGPGAFGVGVVVRSGLHWMSSGLKVVSTGAGFALPLPLSLPLVTSRPFPLSLNCRLQTTDCLIRLLIQTVEPGELFAECELDGSHRAVSLLADDQFCKAAVFFSGIDHFFPVDEHDNIGVLFDGAGLSQVGQLRLPVFTGS